MGQIYILEGADGTGKSTLAAALQEKTKGHILHLTFNKDWDMKSYYFAIYIAARDLSKYQDVIIDRWIPSEVIYGHIYRNGPSFDTNLFLEAFGNKAKWIYCWNEKAVENHLANKKNRDEMFDDMTHVVAAFDKYIETSPLPWEKYNFNNVSAEAFIEDITK